MFYTIYKITNLLDEKFYIGKHQTKKLDDGYFGSGKLLGHAIKKHGIKNFKKEILEVCKTEAEMNAAEKRLVVLSKQSYNLCEGGNGGFGYINSTPSLIAKRDKKEYKRKGYYANIQNMTKPRDTSKGGLACKEKGLGIFNSKHKYDWNGKHHSEETKEKMRASHNPKSHPRGPRGPYKQRNNNAGVCG